MEMYDAETGLKGGNRAYFSLEMTFRRIDGSKRIISFILNTPMERPIFGSAYSYYCFRRQICPPFMLEMLDSGQEDYAFRSYDKLRLWLKRTIKRRGILRNRYAIFG